MGSSPENHTDQHGPPDSGVPPEGETRIKKEREIKDDGRYLIYYDFDGEDERESLRP